MSCDFNGIFARLDKIYGACAQLPCIKCGRCCSSPHLSFVEFAYFLDNALRFMPQKKLAAVISKNPELSERMQGHLVCPLLEDNLCLLHSGRGISCRYIGVPEISEGYGLSEPLCGHITHDNMGCSVTAADIEGGLDELAQINCDVYEYLSEPYFLDSLNLQCWFAVCFDSGITQPLFVRLREMLRGSFDFDYYSQFYQDVTGLAAKLGLIDRFFEFNEQKKPREALFCMEQVRDNFPNTGAYYVSQARTYINFMNSLIQVVENADGKQ